MVTPEEIPAGMMLVDYPFMRENTVLKEQVFNFAYNSGGIGDYIHWTPALRWIIEKHPHLRGRIVTPTYFTDLARLWFAPFAPRYTVHESTTFPHDESLAGEPMRFPTEGQLVNACGWSMFALGFMYYANLDYIPEGYDKLPEIRGDEADISRFNLPENYAVVTVNSTSPVRTLPSQTINEISRYIKEKGLTPVYLGKETLAHDYKAKAPDFDASLGVDLREKTNLIEAACILARARFVVGLDNGLLHLATCSKVPVIFAFTSVNPNHRLIKRDARTIVLTPPEELRCRFCSSNMRFAAIGHDYKYCPYQDILCCKLITPEAFRAAIDKVL